MAWSIPHSYLGRTYMEEGASLDAMINHSLIPRPTCVLCVWGGASSDGISNSSHTLEGQIVLTVISLFTSLP